MLGFASSLLDLVAIAGILIGLQLAVGRTLRDRPLCPTCGHALPGGGPGCQTCGWEPEPALN